MSSLTAFPVKVARLLKGKFKFVSDDTAIKQLLSNGKPVTFAGDYVVVGCLLPTVPARSLDSVGDMLNLPLMLELALNNGVSRLTGEQIGPRTGDPRQFKSYDEVWQAYTSQVEALVRLIMPLRIADRQLFAEYLPTPFQSALFYGCIEKGIDVTAGGTAPYIAIPVSACAAPNVGDSLAAIKKVVFEEGKITMDRLIDALDSNFEGEEEILYLLLNAPKFGNDDDYVDLIVNDVIVNLSNELAACQAFSPGARYTLAAGTASMHVICGNEVGALPSGRKAGQPVCDGGISPEAGKNVSGLTSTMRSIPANMSF